jgi:glucose-1-phosphate thymidylyltransferase
MAGRTWRHHRRVIDIRRIRRIDAGKEYESMKGIVLAGGSGTRLHPATLGINKQLFPVYDKPMIYYPVSVLMLAGIRDILIISSPEYLDNYTRLFGTGEQIGVQFQYAVQRRPEGLAQAFIIGREFVGTDRVALILGDNIFFGSGLSALLKSASARETGATVFGYHVEDPERYGIVTLDRNNKPVRIVEKPKVAESPWAVTGLYFYDNQVLDIAAAVKPSHRGELEITDVNQAYLDSGNLCVEFLSRGFAWLDTGTHESLLEASEFVRTIQHRQGMQVANLEEIAYLNGFIDRAQLVARAKLFEKTTYGKALLKLANTSMAPS